MGKIIILYRLIFIFFESEQEDKKILDQMVAEILWIYSILNSFMHAALLNVVPKYLNFATVSDIYFSYMKLQQGKSPVNSVEN